MTVYRYDKTLKVGRKRTSKTLFVTLALVLIAGVFAYFFINRNNDTGVVGGSVVKISNDPYQEFETEYFKFTASKSWEVASDLSNNTDTFVYRKLKSSNPLGILTIKVNASPPSLITNLVPISVEAGKIVEIGTVSEHCSVFVLEVSNLDPQDVTVESVSFRCWTDGTSYISSVGQRGGGLELALARPNGTTARYSVSYQNTSFDIDEAAILEILETFETR